MGKASSLVYKIDGPEGAVEASSTSEPTLVFIHGWPDSEALWSYQIKSLRSRYTCVTFTLPNFGLKTDDERGFNFNELLERLKATIDEVSQAKPVVLVGHDWGAYLSYLFESRFPDRVCAMITMDVGGDVKPSGPGHALFLVSYQLWLVSAWLLSDRIPAVANGMSKLIAKLGRAPSQKTTRARMNYPYYFLWRALLNKNHSSELLQNYRPHCPLLYLWGSKKRYQFHSQSWLDVVNSIPGSRTVAIPADHWFMLREPDATNTAMGVWLNEQSLSTPAQRSGPSFDTLASDSMTSLSPT